MFQDSTLGANAPNNSPIILPDYQYGTVRHLLLGSLIPVRNTLTLLHTLTYAEPNDWSQTLPTGRPNEVMAILTKRVRVD